MLIPGAFRFRWVFSPNPNRILTGCVQATLRCTRRVAYQRDALMVAESVQPFVSIAVFISEMVRMAIQMARLRLGLRLRTKK